MVLAAKLTSKGQITLPKEVRRLLKAEVGSVIVFEKEDEKIIIRPTKTLLDYRGYLKGRKKPADIETLRERAKEYLAEKVGREKRGR
jgi:AbrB family looped-hinge helix DNA binding protein